MRTKVGVYDEKDLDDIVHDYNPRSDEASSKKSSNGSPRSPLPGGMEHTQTKESSENLAESTST